MSRRLPWPLLTPYDLRSFGRCLGAASAIAALALVVIATTDADHPSWWARAARLSAMSPVIGLIGAAMGLGQARARGEWLALTSSGVRPVRASLGLLLGAWVITAAGACAASLPGTDLGALFPAVPHIDWVRDGAGWWSASAGVRLGPRWQDLTWVQAIAAQPPLAPLRGWVVAAIAVAGLWMPGWLLIQVGVWERVAVTVIAVGAQLWAFHAVAATRSQGWILLSGSVVLMVHSAIRVSASMGRRSPAVADATVTPALGSPVEPRSSELEEQ